VQSTIVLSPTGLVSAIEEDWLFDEMYSAAVLEQLTLEHPQPPGVDPARYFAPQVMENLEPYGYFMRVTAGQHPVALRTVTQFQSRMQGEQLLLSFTAELAEPVDPLEKNLSFSVFDPTYFIHMSHLPDTSDPGTGTPARPAVPALYFKGASAPACRAELKPPQPTPDLFARALALDRNAAPQEDLGIFFAEQVRVLCKKP